MILVRSPLRITLGGGGTDLPSYSRTYGGFCLSAAIDKYVYVALTTPFYPGIYLKYSQLEKVTRIQDVQHPIIREALQEWPELAAQIEITTLADIPAGTGLGSSSSFTTALLMALATAAYRRLAPMDLAALACEIEIDRLQQPIGKQDQYIAAHGGLLATHFTRDGDVMARPVYAPTLADHLCLFFTGQSRLATALLSDQHTRTLLAEPAVLANLHDVKDLGMRSCDAVARGDFATFGSLLNEQWQLKCARQGVSAEIEQLYALGLANGATGGKLVGAGGGGFLLFYAESPRRLRHAMAEAGLEELRMRFDYEGCKVVNS